MKIIADIHLHSYFSRATSKNLNLEHLVKWAQHKGVNIVGTGDIAHPGWLEEMRSKLDPAEEGLFRLKPEIARSVQPEVFKACRDEVRFMLAGEISNIYKKDDRVRKIHNVVFFPTFEALEKFQAELEKIGNIRSDGRPILGLDARDLFEIVLETDPQGHLIPAHIWTPWFSLLGSMSGFDSVEACFGDLTEHIFALETGLSSDPPMNWRLSALDNYTLVSNSDAHSPAKLAREANVFDTEMSYSKLFDALKTGNPEEFLGTIEFFPEEGKYHYDGHRKCGIRWHPKITLDHDKTCPECGRPVTVGVMHRVETLADREPGGTPQRTHPFRSLIPLPEVLAEIYECGVNTKKVNKSFEGLLAKLGPELHILQDVPLDELDKIGGSLLAEAVRRMRHGEVKIAAGYDGEYGKVRLFEENEREKYSVQIGFFEGRKPKKEKAAVQERRGDYGTAKNVDRKRNAANSSGQTALAMRAGKDAAEQSAADSDILRGLNAEQRTAVTHTTGPLVVVAGPGTGKTRTLTHRIAYLLASGQAAPEQILAVTFTNKAAQEMRGRLAQLLTPETAADLTVKTLHAFAAQLLREHGRAIGIDPQFVIGDERIRTRLLKRVRPSLRAQETAQALDLISRAKNLLTPPQDAGEFGAAQGLSDLLEVYGDYQAELRRNQILDYDDLIAFAVTLLTQAPAVLKKLHARYRWISVDEYQDINFAQYQFLNLLTPKAESVCVIGDPDQAIYGFRGASRSFFLKFQEAFPHAKNVQLTKNYRSTQLILDASSQIISKSAEHYTSKIWSDFVSQTKIDIYQAPTAEAEAEYVVHQIEKMVGGTSYFSLDSGRVSDDDAGTRTFGDFAVLYRLNALSTMLQTAFDRSGIPYQTTGDVPLFARPEAQQLLDFLWFAYQPHSNLHLQSILDAKLDANTIAKLMATAEKRGESLWQAMQHDLILANLTPSQRRTVQSGIADLRSLLKETQTRPVAELLDYVSQACFPESYFTGTEARKTIFKQMRSRAIPFGRNLEAFLETTVLCNESDFHDPRADRVSLMTLHAAKGLEFKVVFIVGCEETLIPYQRDEKIDDLEEERRLFYVGMTRAQEKLTLSHVKSRLLFGKRRQNSPSRFLSHVEDSLKEIREMEYKTNKTEKLKKSQMKLF